MASLNLILGVKTDGRVILAQGDRKSVGQQFRKARQNRKYKSSFESLELWCKSTGLLRVIDFGKARRKEATQKTEELENAARGKALPGALELADENGVSLRDVKGSGTDGAILAEDVEAFLASRDPITDEDPPE